MFYCSTSELEAIGPDILRKLKRLDMTGPEAEEMVRVVKHVRAVRNVTEYGDGEVCIPLVGGMINKIKTTFVDFLRSAEIKKSK